jgi:hypothetical protein
MLPSNQYDMLKDQHEEMMRVAENERLVHELESGKPNRFWDALRRLGQFRVWAMMPPRRSEPKFSSGVVAHESGVYHIR